MSLFHLVKQDDRVGTTPHGFGELTALFITDVTRRGTDQTRDGVLLHVLTHVDTHQSGLVVEEELRQRLGQLGLADARGAQKEKRASRTVRVADSRPGATYRIRNRLDRSILTNKTFVQPLLHMEQLLLLALHHPPNGNASPRGNNLGDVGGADLLGDHPRGFLLGLGSSLHLLLKAGNLTVEDLGRSPEVALALVLVGRSPQLVNPCLELTDLVETSLLSLPARLQATQGLLLVSHFSAQPR